MNEKEAKLIRYEMVARFMEILIISLTQYIFFLCIYTDSTEDCEYWIAVYLTVNCCLQLNLYQMIIMIRLPVNNK